MTSDNYNKNDVYTYLYNIWLTVVCHIVMLFIKLLYIAKLIIILVEIHTDTSVED